MDDIGTTVTATCGSCDWSPNGYRIRCDDPAPYRAEFRIHDGTGPDYSLCLCVRHAAAARADDSYDDLKRIYSA